MQALFQSDSAHPLVRGLTIAALAVLYSAGCWWIFSTTAGNWGLVWTYRMTFLSGWGLTLVISAAALVLSTLIGIAAALARISRFLPLRYSAAFYIETVRGLPLIVLLLAGYFGVAPALHWNERVSAGVVLLSVFSGAYIAEIVRAGIESIGRSQWDSARAVGLTASQTYWHVVAPQVLRQALPPLAGQFASIIKDSSLLCVIGIGELTLAAQQVASATYSTLSCYLVLGVCYLALTLPLSLWTKSLEKRLRFES